MNEASSENVTGRLAIRGAIGIITALVPIAAGIMARSLWTILLFGLLFSIAYVIGRFEVWRPLLAAGLSVRLITMLLSTLSVQVCVVAVLYLIGSGFGWLFGDTEGFRPLASMDVGLAFVLLVAMGIGAIANGSTPTGREN